MFNAFRQSKLGVSYVAKMMYDPIHIKVYKKKKKGKKKEI
jgi:hypothetical protein